MLIRFFKYFFIALILQVALLLLTVYSGVGDGLVYVFYAVPYILFFPGDETNKVEISIITISLVPIIVYALVTGVGACVFKKLRSR